MPSKAGSRQKSYEIEVVEGKGQTLVRTESDIKGQRALFLECIALKAPEVLITLQNNVLPLFENVPVWIRRRKSRGPEVPNISTIPFSKVKFIKLPEVLLYKNLHFYAQYPQAAALKHALETWAKVYDFSTEWLLDAALSTLNCWADPVNDPRKDQEAQLSFGSALFFKTLLPLTWHKDVRPPVQYHHPNWQSGETWAEYERAQVAEFKVHLKRQNLETLQSGYSLESPENADHLSWVALAYGRRLNFRQIADLPAKERDGHLVLRVRRSGGINIQAIQQAVHEKALLIGLPRLVTERGRPKKHQPSRSLR